MNTKMTDVVQNLINEKKFGVLFILARYFYRIGDPIVTDAFYDKLETAIRKGYYDVFKEYLERTYDDDPVPTEFLASVGIKPVYFVKQEGRKDLYEYLNEDKSYSIKSVHGYKAAYEFFMTLRSNQLDFVASLKMDGVNTKMLYQNGRFALSLSRGRNAGDSFDYTDNSAKVMPERMDFNLPLAKVTGESYVVAEGLEYLRQKYHKPDGYVTSKSAAISMLRVAHDLNDYKYLRTRVFSAEGVADTLVGTFEYLQTQGVDTPPYIFFHWQDIPADYEEFKIWLKKEILDPIWQEGQGIPSDGVVIEVNDLGWAGVENNQYVSRQLALKFEYWGNSYYKGVVKAIHVKQQRVNKSIRLEIETVKTIDGSKATYINSFSPSILFNSHASVGSTIYFERNSNAINVLLYGEKLKKVLDGSIEE